MTLPRRITDYLDRIARDLSQGRLTGHYGTSVLPGMSSRHDDLAPDILAYLAGRVQEYTDGRFTVVFAPREIFRRPANSGLTLAMVTLDNPDPAATYAQLFQLSGATANWGERASDQEIKLRLSRDIEHDRHLTQLADGLIVKDALIQVLRDRVFQLLDGCKLSDQTADDLNYVAKLSGQSGNSLRYAVDRLCLDQLCTILVILDDTTLPQYT